MMEKIDDQANAKMNQSLQSCSTIKTKTAISTNKSITNKLEDLQKFFFIFYIYSHVFHSNES